MKKLLVITGIVLLAAAVTAFTLTGSKQAKAGYINNSELYHAFEFKKELEGQLKNVQSMRKSKLDSLGLLIQASQGKASQEQVIALQREYMMKRDEFESDNQRLAEQYDEQVWKQLNEYIQTYGKEKGYAFIYGASGNGSLMYADPGFDLTKELIEYSNIKFQGK